MNHFWQSLVGNLETILLSCGCSEMYWKLIDLQNLEMAEAKALQTNRYWFLFSKISILCDNLTTQQLHE